jgi:hypothetical protein
MVSFVEDFELTSGNIIIQRRGLVSVTPQDPTPDPPPVVDPPSVAARRALRDDGQVTDAFGVPTGETDPYDASKPLLYSIDGSTCGLLPGYAKEDLTQKGATTYSDTSSTVKIVENIWFTGNVSITGSNYLFRNCFFGGSGAGTSTAGALIFIWPPAVRNIVFEDCEVQKLPSNSPNGSIGIYGHHFTLRRCNFHGTEDGIRPYSQSGPLADHAVFVYGTWVHDLAFKSPDSAWGGNQGDNMTHNDAFQIQGGGGILVQHCRINGSIDPAIGDASVPDHDDPAAVTSKNGFGHVSGNHSYPLMYATSCIMLSPRNAAFGVITFRDCELSGGSVLVNTAGNVVASDGAGITITNCRITGRPRDRIGGSPDLAAWNNGITGMTLTLNRWAYTGDGHTAGAIATIS